MWGRWESWQFGAGLEGIVEVLDFFVFEDPYNFFGVADLMHTAALTNLLVRDGSGNPIPGVTLTGESGTQYPLDARNTVPGPSPIPGPHALVLLASGLTGLGGIAWGRRRRV